MSNLGRISRDHSARLISHDGNQLQSTTNKKLDTALVQQTAINTKLDSLSGAINNNIGDATVKLQTYVYAHDVSNGLSRPLKCDSAGRLECSVDALEITAETINLSTDTLEAKTQAITDKLDTFAGAGNNNIGEGSSKLQTYLYARDVSAGNFKPLVCDGDAHLQIDCLSSALPSGAATEAKQDSGITHLATIAGDTTSLDGKVTTCNTGAVVVSSSVLPSGASTAALQGTANTALGEIEGAVENLELAVGTNTATAPTRSLQIGGKYVDGTFRDIKVDNIGKVIVDSPAGSDLCTRLDAIQAAVQVIDNAISGNEMQVDVVSIPTVAVTLSGGATEAKQDVQETTLNSIQSALEGTLTTTSAATLQTGSAVIGKLAANSGVDIGDVDVTSLPLTFNSGNKDATCQRVVVATDDINLAAIKSSLDNLDNAVDGNYLNVNANIAGTDVDANSGNKSAATQRVVIATDDVNLSAIKTAVEVIDNAISGSEMQCDIVASLPAGTNAIGKLAANSGVDIGDVDVTSLPLTFNSGNKDATCQRVVVATDDVNLSAIKSSLDNLDNAVDGNYLNVNANIAGTDVDSNSGNKSAATQRVVIADDDVNLSAIKTSVQLIDDAVVTDDGAVTLGSQKGMAIMGFAGTQSVDANDACMLACSTAGRLEVDIKNIVSTAVTNTALTALEACIGTDGDGTGPAKCISIAGTGALGDIQELRVDGSGNLQVTSTLSATDNAVLDEIQTNGDNIQTKLDTMDSQIDLLEGTNTIKDVEWLSGASISDQALSDVLDTEGYQNVFIYGENSGSISGNTLKIFGSNASAGTYYSVGQLAVVTSDSGRYLLREDTPLSDMPSPRYLKVFNATGSTQNITKLRAVMSQKLRYV